jgi:hypothetical protein
MSMSACPITYRHAVGGALSGITYSSSRCASRGANSRSANDPRARNRDRGLLWRSVGVCRASGMGDVMGKEQGEESYELLFDSMAKLSRDERIGFLLGAIDDGMFEAPENWMQAPDDDLAHWGVSALVNAAEAIVKGRTLPSEKRGAKPFGIA